MQTSKIRADEISVGDVIVDDQTGNRFPVKDVGPSRQTRGGRTVVDVTIEHASGSEGDYAFGAEQVVDVDREGAA